MFGPYPSTISLFANVVFLLFVFTGLNAICRKVAPRIVFSQAELLTIYTMLAISTGLAGLDGVAIISQMMPHGAWFGKANKWEGWLNAFPSWLTVTDPDAVRGHYLGNTTLYRLRTLSVWIVPFLSWTGFIGLLMFVANCINVLVRPQWADRERLTFPITWLPIEMTDPPGSSVSFFRSRVMWAGFSIAALISLWNGIAFLYPSLPAVPVGVTDLKEFLTSKPWSAIDWMPITYYPIAIGLGFLLPIDLLFSCWFFFFYWKAQVLVSNVMRMGHDAGLSFIPEQGFGSLMGLFLFYLFTGRRTYAAILRSAWHKGADAEANRDVSARTRLPDALSSRQALAGYSDWPHRFKWPFAPRSSRSLVGRLIVFRNISGIDCGGYTHTRRAWAACTRFSLYGTGRDDSARLLHKRTKTTGHGVLYLHLLTYACAPIRYYAGRFGRLTDGKAEKYGFQAHVLRHHGRNRCSDVRHVLGL